MQNTTPPSATSTFDSMTLTEKMDFVQGICFFPAITVMAFLRRKVGFRRLKPIHLFVMAMIMCLVANGSSFMSSVPVVGSFASSTSGQSSFAYSGAGLTIYAVGMLAWGLWQRHLRWKELCNGVRWHTKSLGYSYLNFLPLREDIINRFVDPAICIVIGLLLLPISHPLGIWIIMSGAAMRIFEQAVYDKATERELDVLDSLTESELHTDLVQAFTSQESGSGTAARPIEEGVGIPSGQGLDIQKQIALRRAHQVTAQSAIAAPSSSNGLVPKDDNHLIGV